MTTNRKKIPFLFVFFLVLLEVSFTQTPAWYPNKLKKVYPPSQYLAVIGEGLSTAIARNNAKSQLSEYFGAEIKSNTNIRDFEKQTNGESFSETNFQQNIQVQTSVQLSNIEYSETFQNKNTYYVVGYLDKVKTAMLTQSDIANLETKFRSIHADIKDTENLLSGYAAYQTLLDLSREIVLKQSFLAILRGIPSGSDALDNEYNILSEFKNYSKNISVTVDSEDDVSDELKSYLESVLSIMYFNVVDNPRGADYTITLASSWEPVQLSNNYANANWRLVVNFLNNSNGSKGVSDYSWQRSGRVSVLDESQQEQAVEEKILAMINNDFEKDMVKTLSGALTDNEQ